MSFLGASGVGEPGIY